MLKPVAGAWIAALVLLAAAGCGFDTSATFNADGSVVVGLKFLFPQALMSGANGASVSGFSPADIADANKKLQAQYPGAKVSLVTEGDESGAAITVPFKTEKDAFAFMTAPSKLSPAGATSGSGMSLNLSNTGGLFTSATHTTSGQVDTYTFKTAPQQVPTPSPGEQQVISDEEIASVFVITFALTVPHTITSAPGALFTLDRKTAIWKLSWTKAETLTATTGPDSGLVANVSQPARDNTIVYFVGFAAIVVGFLLGVLMPRRTPKPAPVAVQAPPAEPTAPAMPPLPDTPAGDPGLGAWPGPPPDAPPPGAAAR